MSITAAHQRYLVLEWLLNPDNIEWDELIELFNGEEQVFRPQVEDIQVKHPIEISFPFSFSKAATIRSRW